MGFGPFLCFSRENKTLLPTYTAHQAIFPILISWDELFLFLFISSFRDSYKPYFVPPDGRCTLHPRVGQRSRGRAGAGSGKGDCPEPGEAGAGWSRPAAESRVCEQAEELTNELAVDRVGRAHSPLVKKLLFVPFCESPGRRSLKEQRRCGACVRPRRASPLAHTPTFTRANWVARLKPEGTNWCCGAFLQSAKDQSN